MLSRQDHSLYSFDSDFPLPNQIKIKIRKRKKGKILDKGKLVDAFEILRDLGSFASAIKCNRHTMSTQ